MIEPDLQFIDNASAGTHPAMQYVLGIGAALALALVVATVAAIAGAA